MGDAVANLRQFHLVPSCHVLPLLHGYRIWCFPFELAVVLSVVMHDGAAILGQTWVILTRCSLHLRKSAASRQTPGHDLATSAVIDHVLTHRSAAIRGCHHLAGVLGAST